MLLFFYFSILSAVAHARCEDPTETFCALAEEITSDDDNALFFENDVVGFKSFSTLEDIYDGEFRDFFNKLSANQQSWLKERGPIELYEGIGFDFYHLHISCSPSAYWEVNLKQANWEANEDDIYIFANLESPFCSPRKNLSEGENCQTDLLDPAFLLYEPFSPEIDAGCDHGLKCMKINAAMNGGICVQNDHPKVGCGQSCADDEYCSVVDGDEVTDNFYSPNSPEQMAWSSEPVVSVVCPFHANIDGLYPTLASLSLRYSIQRYNTPFCTCRKRLQPNSLCQLNHHLRFNLDVLLIPTSSHNLIANNEDDVEYKFKHRNVEHIDVGCSSDRICVAPKNNLINDSWGKCAKAGEEITKKAINSINLDMIQFDPNYRFDFNQFMEHEQVFPGMLPAHMKSKD